jgi:hypothetical protein
MDAELTTHGSMITRQSPEVDKLATALVHFQGHAPRILKDRDVEVRSKSGNRYDFKYATFGNIIETTKEARLAAEIAVMQITVYDPEPWLITKVFHASGQWMSSEVRLREFDSPQAYGGYVSYMKRYQYAMILGLAPDDDDDANIYEGNDFHERNDDQRAAPPPEERPANGDRPPVRNARAPTSAPPSASAADTTFRKLVNVFNKALKDALDPQEADKIWLAEIELRGKMNAQTLEFVTKTFSDVWKRTPPPDQAAAAE